MSLLGIALLLVVFPLIALFGIGVWNEAHYLPDDHPVWLLAAALLAAVLTGVGIGAIEVARLL